jgi:hypothetical protein
MKPWPLSSVRVGLIAQHQMLAALLTLPLPGRSPWRFRGQLRAGVTYLPMKWNLPTGSIADPECWVGGKAQGRRP